MRKIMALAGALLIAACGNGNRDDFTVDVAMSPDRAKAELAQLDGGIALSALSLPEIVRDSSTENMLSFTMPGEGEEGELIMRFEEVGTNGSRIHVALSLPTKVANIRGEPMILHETMAEEMLQQRLKSWAEGMDSGFASIAPLNEALAGLSIALRPEKMATVLDAAGDPEKLAGLLGPEFLALMEAETGETEYLAVADDLDEPMLDPSEETWQASAPMDDARGSSADAVSEGAGADWGSSAY